MNVSSTGLSRLGKAKALTLAALVAAFGMLALAGSSKAAPTNHTLNADHGKLTLGAVFPNNTIVPAPVMGSHCPTMQLVNPPAFQPPADMADCGPSPLSALVPNYPDGNAHITVSEENGTATVAAADFKTPMTYVPKPGDPNTMVPIKTSAPNGLTGTWNSTTGELSLTGDLRIDVATGATGNTPADISWCRIDAPGITWSTGLNAVTPGIPFTDPSGLDGTGAISASWADLPNGVEVNSGDCSTVNAVIHDTGAIWFGVGKDTPPPPPVCEPPLEGLWPDCEEPPAPPAKVEISKITMSPKKHTTRAGRSFNLQIKVFNKGAKSGWVTVKLKVNRKAGVNVRKTVKVKAFANSKGVVKTPFRSNRRAKGKYKVTATVAGKKAVSTITVKPVKKKRR